MVENLSDGIQCSIMTDAFGHKMEDPDRPVVGTGRFIGRAGLAQNLVRRCLAGQGLVLFGGPKLGKTSMLLQVQWLLQQMAQPSVKPEAVYLDLRDPAVRNEFLAGRWREASCIRLLDHCESLLNETTALEIARILQTAGGASTVWAGDRLWHDAVQAVRGPTAIRRAPLAVLVSGEARQLLPRCLSAEQAAELLDVCGTHPFVLKVVTTALQHSADDLYAAMRKAAVELQPFFAACRAAIRTEGEAALLDYLTRVVQAVNPREAAQALGVPSVKASADMLCAVGVISRWNLNEGAMLHAQCRLFNEWYLAMT